jgi:cell division protein FtsN
VKQRPKMARLKPRRLLIGSAAPPWLWVLALISVGGFVILVGYMEAYQVKNPAASTSLIEPLRQEVEKKVQSAKDNPISTTFDFYKLLPEIESIIPERNEGQKDSRQPEKPVSNKADTKAAIAAPESAPTALPVGRYFLQAGSFKDYQAADSRRASLALIGLESDIQNANIPNRGLWYRVRIGPFASLSVMRVTRKRLKNNNIDSIMLTVKK